MYSLYILMGFIDTFTQMYHVLWPYASPYSIFPFPAWVHFLFLGLLLYSCYICYYLVIYKIEVPHQDTPISFVTMISSCIYFSENYILSFFFLDEYNLNMYRSTFLKFIFLLMDIYIVTTWGTGVWRCRSTVKQRAATFTKEFSKMPVAMCFRICVLCGVCEW